MDKTRNNIRGCIKISDVTNANNPEIIVQKENAIHYENFSQALANSVTNRTTGYIEEMHFGNGGTAVDSTMYGFTPERALEIKQFLLNELDVDIQNEDQRIRDDLVVEAPRLDEEQAAYTMLQVLQQQYGSLGIRYDNISNASTLVNKLLKNVAVESKIKEKESIAASKRAAEAALDKETRLNVLRRANPNLSDDELKELYPETFAIETVDVVGELGPFGEGVGNFRENLFANRLQRSMQDLLQPELDLNEKRNNINQATSNFYRAARGARNLVQSAPSLNRGINT